MGLLNRLFGSAEALARQAETDEGTIVRHWNEYLGTVSEKEKIIIQLPSSFGQGRKILQRLKQLLDLELVDIRTEEQQEDDLISTLLALEHSRRIKRVRALESCLAYVATKYQYVYGLLGHLYATLQSEARLVKKLEAVNALKNLKKYRKLAELFQAELRVEKAILEKISAIGTFQTLLHDLVTGEQIIQRMTAKEKRLMQRLKKGSPRGGMIDQWVMGVFNAIEDKVHEAIATGVLEAHHDVDLEFVNGPDFIPLVRETIKSLRSKEATEQMITAFAHLFREKYNHERD